MKFFTFCQSQWPSRPGLNIWGEWSLSSTIISHLNLVDRELFITQLSTGLYCFTFITFKEWFSVKSLT
jgi:hypothetical protein